MISSKTIAEQVRRLPPLPDTALRLMEVVNNPLSTVQNLVDAIRYDQAVTSQVLRICNSAYFGLSRRVGSLNDALLCLGTVKVMQLVMAVHVNEMLDAPQSGYGLPPGALGRHSMGVALAASAIAQKVKLPNASQVFTAGLLHDIGKIVLNQHVSEQYIQIVAKVNNERLSFLEAEREVLGFGHPDVGGDLAEQWKLPDNITRCIRWHHDPNGLETPDPLVDIVHTADCVCLMIGLGLGEDGLAYRAEEEAVKRCDLRETDLHMVGAQTLGELQRIDGMFSEPAAAGSSESAART